MKFYVVDECNQSWDESIGFFIYGGIVIHDTEIKELASRLIQIKREYGIKKSRPIKWSNNKWGSEGILDEEIHKQIKNEILDLVSSSKTTIIICLSPQDFYHTIVSKKDKVTKVIDPETQKRSHEYGINDALHKFNLYLDESDDIGMVLADEFNEAFKIYMTDHCFNKFPSVHLSNIVHPVIQLNNEYSHLHQINDVVLGAIYYSLREMNINLLPKLNKNFWGYTGDPKSIFGKGFTAFPEMPRYQYYIDLKKRIRGKFVRQVGV
jgi:hypothetical protein